MVVTETNLVVDKTGVKEVLNKSSFTQQTISSKLEDGSQGYRIAFSCDKTLGTSLNPNPISLQIWNLNEESRPHVHRWGNRVEVYAGYQKNAVMVFSGNTTRAITKKQGSDYITTVEAQDGILVSQNTFVNKSYDKGTSKAQVINDLVDQMAPAGVMKGLISGVPSNGYNNGIVLTGSAVEQLSQICDANDLIFVINNGEASVVKRSGGTNGKPAFFLSEDTGLVGIPEIREIDFNGKPNFSFKSLFNAELAPLQQFTIKSKFVNGIFTITKSKFSCDSWGGSFYTECEAS